MRIHCIQHVPFENPGAILNWSEKQGHELLVTRIFAGERLHAIETWDWLFVLGGPMSVHDENEYPWLNEEKRYIKEVIQTEKTVVGICLGAQLIAHVLGAKVFPNEQKEIGWFPIQWTQASIELPLFPNPSSESVVFHWHGETFDLPDRAQLLASSAACKNQAFIYEKSVIGLQFHLEMMQRNVQLIIEHCGEEISVAPYIQSEKEMLNAPLQLERSNMLLYGFLDQLEQQYRHS
ncbi:amidotransferase [Paenibacillus sp. LMG 31461]|uniref:Amidotransferase n=1 Tax=Paenibacillus plantarum TaxID=2654975 RepID=A0ABX1XKD2_9BACL|nr:type 1 glutamine amidotransferase [Paenibacillus plantarum]NOU68882.1 amidotransferase [Paenibacillus plantarum]